MSTALDAVFFDIDDTLFSTSQFAESARQAAVDAMIGVGLKVDREVCVRELYEVIHEFTTNHDKHFDKLISRLPRAASQGINPALIVAAGVVAYHETKYKQLKVHDDALELLRALATTDLVRGIITAGLTLKQAEKIIRLRVYEYLSPQAIFITDQIGISKPNPKLYEKCLRALDLRADRCMYVGDNPTHDIDPPNKIGMITVRHRRSGRFQGVLGETRPDFEVDDFQQLGVLLVERFGIPL